LRPGTKWIVATKREVDQEPQAVTWTRPPEGPGTASSYFNQSRYKKGQEPQAVLTGIDKKKVAAQYQEPWNEQVDQHANPKQRGGVRKSARGQRDERESQGKFRT
jgi:hypothetical protein